MAPSLKRFRFVNGIPAASKWIDTRVLAANTAEAHTVPSGAKYVAFAADGDFYANFDQASIAVPTGDVTDGSGGEFNPSARYIGDIATIRLIAAAACTVTMSFYDAAD